MMFEREIKTRPLDELDYEILKESVRIVDEHGQMTTPTLEEMKEMGWDRIIAAKNILTGEWEPR